MILVLFSLLLVFGIGFYIGGKSNGIASRPAPVVIASFQKDFQAIQATNGWRYLWTAFGPIGDDRNYADLLWDGTRYTVDGSLKYPGASPGRFVRITREGGHPGQGFGQGVREVGNDVARYVMVAFTVPTRGNYRIVDSRVSRNEGVLGGNIDLRVFVNNLEVGAPLPCRSAEGLSFNRELGSLSAGSVIYVAVGPNETDSDDAFALDFSIAL